MCAKPPLCLVQAPLIVYLPLALFNSICVTLQFILHLVFKWKYSSSRFSSEKYFRIYIVPRIKPSSLTWHICRPDLTCLLLDPLQSLPSINFSSLTELLSVPIMHQVLCRPCTLSGYFLSEIIFLLLFHSGNSFVLFKSEHVRSCGKSSLKALSTATPMRIAYDVGMRGGKTKPQFVIIYM